jgi:hypothetical protein
MMLMHEPVLVIAVDIVTVFRVGILVTWLFFRKQLSFWVWFLVGFFNLVILVNLDF